METKTNTKRLTPLKAIRKWCLGCVGGSSNEVKECTGNLNDIPCPLWQWRTGKSGRVVKTKGQGIPKGLLAYQKAKGHAKKR